MVSVFFLFFLGVELLNLKYVIKCQKTDSGVSKDMFRGEKSLFLKNDARGTGLKVLMLKTLLNLT